MQAILIGADVNDPLFSFDDSTLFSVQCSLVSSLSGDQLSIDQFNPVLLSSAYLDLTFQTSEQYNLMTSDGFQFLASPGLRYLDEVPYGTPIYYYVDSELMGKFYVNNIVRTAAEQFTVSAMSAIGILDNQQHNGGLYTGQTFATIAADIIDSAISFSCAGDVSSIPVYGWLPIDTKRNNLHQLLFATGVMLDKDANGDVYFRFQDSSNVKIIPDDRIYIDGNIDYLSRASKVEVTEHSYTASVSDETVTLFDNTGGTAVSNTFVAFTDAPIHDLAVTGSLTINSSGVNWAIVSGLGTLTGKKYSHITHIVTQTAPADTEKIVSVTDATLVSILNSINVSKRVLSYYNAARTIGASLVLVDEHPGDQLSFTDAFGGPTTAFLSSMNIEGSTTMKAKCELISGYIPSGSGNNYTQYVILVGIGTYTFPADVENALVVMIGGGSGGEAGARGQAGAYYTGSATEGGAGGDPGDGGSGGKIYSVALVNPSGTVPYSCGNAGVGGTPLGYNVPPATNPGTSGTDTSFGAYSSASGTSIDSGHVNLFTGVVYGSKGKSGVAGANGTDSNNPTSYVTFSGQTWSNGAKAEDWDSPNRFLGGGYGGGAAVGANGDAGAEGRYDSLTHTYDSGAGGDGATPTIIGAGGAAYGCGGGGGHGGGGGGAAGFATGDAYVGPGPGIGGRGSVGGNGAAGCIIIYM